MRGSLQLSTHLSCDLNVPARIAPLPSLNSAVARTTQLIGHLSSSADPRKMALPETMKAIAIDRTGDIDVLEVKTLPVPAPTAGNVLVKASL